jgi:hypothetical protein
MVRTAMITPQGRPARQPWLSAAGCLNLAAYAGNPRGDRTNATTGTRYHQRITTGHADDLACR